MRAKWTGNSFGFWLAVSLSLHAGAFAIGFGGPTSLPHPFEVILAAAPGSLPRPVVPGADRGPVQAVRRPASAGSPSLPVAPQSLPAVPETPLAPETAEVAAVPEQQPAAEPSLLTGSGADMAEAQAAAPAAGDGAGETGAGEGKGMGGGITDHGGSDGQAVRSGKPGAARLTPPRYLHAPRPPYPLLARQRGWQGAVELRVQVAEDGNVRDVTVWKSSGYEVLDRAARETVACWKFRPALEGSRPVATEHRVPIEFRVQGR